MLTQYVLGLDWINNKHGWACCRIDLDRHPYHPEFHVVPSHAEGQNDLICDASKIIVDAPVGLPTGVEVGCILRDCDRAAKQWIGVGLKSSVFPVPFQAELCEWRRRRNAAEAQKKGHFRGLLPAIDSAERIVAANHKVLESHPEIVFAALATGQLSRSTTKNTMFGMLVRLGILLERADLTFLLRDLTVFPRIPTDNFIDAMAMAVVARQWSISDNLMVLRTSDRPEPIGEAREYLMALPALQANRQIPRDLAPLSEDELFRLASIWRSD